MYSLSNYQKRADNDYLTQTAVDNWMGFASQLCYSQSAAIQLTIRKTGDCMGMTDNQFKGFIGFVLDDIKEVLENMPDGKG